MTAAVKKRARWGEIELIRVAAALLVVSFHIRQNMAVTAAPSLAQGVHRGQDYPYQNVHWFEIFMTNIDVLVDFFFVTSAFLLALPFMRALVAGTPLPSIRSFALGRALRAIPLYWALVLVIWTMRNHGYPGEWLDLVEHLTFSQWMDSHRIFYTIGPAWSLADEIWLYALVPLVPLLVVGVTRRLSGPASRAIVITTPLLALVAASVYFKYWVDDVAHKPGDAWAWRFGVPSKVDVFCFGMLLSLVVALAGERKMPAWCGVLLRVASLAGLFWFLSHRVADFGAWQTFAHTGGGIASALVVGAIVLSRPGTLARRLQAPWLASAGALTFALYIGHESIIDPLTHAGLLSLDPHHMIRNWIVGLPCALALAWLLRTVIEEPSQRLRLLWDRTGRRQLEHYAEEAEDAATAVPVSVAHERRSPVPALAG